MSEGKEGCRFFEIQKGASDYEEGKMNCVSEIKTKYGKFWISKPVHKESNEKKSS